jgi:low affinity Fe/Cu permease
MNVNKWFAQIAETVSHAAGHAVAFIICCIVVIVWAASGPVFGFSDTWQLVINTGTTIVTFLMVFLIQNTQNRDSAALTRLGEVTAHPAAFALVVIYAGLWFAFDRKTLDWHAFATLGTLFMTLIIQRAEHRDTQALQAKLDELLRVHGAARNELTTLDKEEPEEIERRRKQEASDSSA